MVFGDEASRTLHLLGAAFHTDHSARFTNPPGEQTQTTLRATANLDYAPVHRCAQLIEQPSRVGGKF